MESGWKNQLQIENVEKEADIIASISVFAAKKRKKNEEAES